MILSEVCDIERIKLIGIENNYIWELIVKKKFWGEKNYIFEIEKQ